MIDFYKVGSKIASYRKLNQMTQDELSDALGVTRQALSKWELGVSVPSIDTLLALCKIFKTNFEDLLCLDEEEKLEVDINNIFEKHNRLYILNKLIQGELKINIPEVFYQLSSNERMQVLKAIKDKRITCNKHDLYPKLTPPEQKYLYNKVTIIGGHTK